MKTVSALTRYRLLLCLTTLLLCLPILSVAYPPLVDYPNHLARAHILDTYDATPSYRQTFERQYAPIPNLACDLLILLFSQFAGIFAAGKLFLVLTAVLFAAGCHLLGRAIHGRPTWLALPCCFFFYNWMLLYGFINYLFGVALFSIALAYWMEWRERWTLPRYVCVSSLVFAAYLSHLSAYVFLGVAFTLLAGWGVFKHSLSLRAAAFNLAHLVPPLAAFAAFMGKSGERGYTEWNTVGGKFIDALPLFRGYDYKTDVLFGAALLVITVLTFLRAERIRVSAPIFLTGLVFFVLYLLFPKAVLTAWAVDARFIIPAALLVVLSLRVTIPHEAGRLLLLLTLVVFSLRVGFIWTTWVSLDRRINAQVEMFSLLPEGAKVYPLFVAPDESERLKIERAFDHVVHYATIYRRAFIPTIFAWRSQQPLVIRNSPRHVQPSPGSAEQWLQSADVWTDYLNDYEYVWSNNTDARLAHLLRERAVPVSEAGGCMLWKVSSKQ